MESEAIGMGAVSIVPDGGVDKHPDTNPTRCQPDRHARTPLQSNTFTTTIAMPVRRGRDVA